MLVSAIFTFKLKLEVLVKFWSCKLPLVTKLELLLLVSTLIAPLDAFNITGALALNAALALALVKYKLPTSPTSPVLMLSVPVFPFTLWTGAPGVNISIQSLANVP